MMHNLIFYKKTIVAGWSGIAFATLLFCTVTTVNAHNQRICSSVASTTFKACKADIRDDFLIQKAKCQNRPTSISI